MHWKKGSVGLAVAGRKRKAIGPHEKNEKAMREEKTAGPWLFGAGLEQLGSWCCQAKLLRKPGVLGLLGMQKDQNWTQIGPKLGPIKRLIIKNTNNKKMINNENRNNNDISKYGIKTRHG